MIAVRRLAVILVADVDDYSRTIGEDNTGVALRCRSGRMRKVHCSALLSGDRLGRGVIV
jgi:hypothetical protein